MPMYFEKDKTSCAFPRINGTNHLLKTLGSISLWLPFCGDTFVDDCRALMFRCYIIRKAIVIINYITFYFISISCFNLPQLKEEFILKWMVINPLMPFNFLCFYIHSNIPILTLCYKNIFTKTSIHLIYKFINSYFYLKAVQGNYFH